MLAHQIPVILGGGFDPSVIFSEMPGAWLEPRIGGMWQENTGVTPTTSGEQTIGLLLGLDQGAVYGNNLVASTIGVVWWVNLPATPASTVSGDQLTFGGLFSGRKYYVNTTTEGKIYELRFTIRRISGNTYLWFFHEGSASGDFTQFAITDTATTYSVKVLGKSGSGLVAFGIQDRNTSGHGTIEITNISVREVLGNHATQATAANRPTLQYANGFPLVRCDSNDFMTVSLPNLGSGVFSSSGSVYFALNTGMSALHNQSIGTSYSAPIQSINLYGAVIVPSRLSDQREAQLQTYFEKLAGLR